MLWLWVFGLGMTVLIAGCGTVATPRYLADSMLHEAQGSATAIVGQAYTEAYTSPTMTATATPTATLTPTQTQTPVPSNTPSPTPTEVPSLTPTEIASASADNALESVASVDAANGQVLFNTFQSAASFACATCHRADSEAPLIGPGLLNVSIRAESRVANLDAAEYIYQSIVNPGVYVVEGFPDQLMPRNWADIYSNEEIYDIIAYLFTLEE